jgi:hypothetical protein
LGNEKIRYELEQLFSLDDGLAAVLNLFRLKLGHNLVGDINKAANHVSDDAAVWDGLGRAVNGASARRLKGLGWGEGHVHMPEKTQSPASEILELRLLLSKSIKAGHAHTLTLGVARRGLTHSSTSFRKVSIQPFCVCILVQQMCIEAGNCSMLMS